MKITPILFFFLLLQLLVFIPLLYPQGVSPGDSRLTLDQQYEMYISGALRLQVQADSLSREANLRRREIAFAQNASERSEVEKEVLALENSSSVVQKRADSLYSQARAIELRMIAGGNKGTQAGQPPVSTVQSPNPGNTHDNPAELSRAGDPASQHGTADAGQPTFIVLGGKDISSVLSRRELALAAELEADHLRATQLLWKLSDLNDERNNLMHVLNSDPGRREKRRTEQRLEELENEIFESHIEAMVLFEKINDLRYTAAKRFLEDKRTRLGASASVKEGLKHEETAEEKYRNASGLRKTSEDLLSDRYLQDYLVKAYNEELAALSELEKAFDIYNTALESPARPGRIDPGLALSQSRALKDDSKEPFSEGAQDSANTSVKMDFGFSVFTESPYSGINPVPVNVMLPEGLVYTIQLGIFNTVLTPGTFGGLHPVMAEKEPGGEAVRYNTGVFGSFVEAENALIEVNRHGFSDAFVVAYNNNTRMSVHRARQVERNSQTDQAASPRVIEEPSGTTPVPVPEKVVVITYRLQLGAFSKPVEQDVLNRWQSISGSGNVEYTVNSNGLYVYSTGIFNYVDICHYTSNYTRGGTAMG
jgi:hypothetical protein